MSSFWRKSYKKIENLLFQEKTSSEKEIPVNNEQILFPKEITSKEKEIYFNEVEFYFPKDLQLSTWGFLSPIELCCVSQVCKSFNQTSSSDIFWIHFVKPPKEITKDYKNYFLQKMKQFWKMIIKYPKSFPFFFSNKLFDKRYCPQALEYQARFPELFETHRLKSNNPDFWKPDCPLSPEKVTLKILVTGCTGVGKGALLERLGNDSFFIEKFSPKFNFKTFAAQLGTCNIGPTQIIKFQVWEYYGPRPKEGKWLSQHNPYASHQAVIVVGDATDPDSLQMMPALKAEAETYANDNNIPILFCINKCDLKDLSEKEIKKHFNLDDHWIKFSAKTGKNADELFATILTLCGPLFPKASDQPRPVNKIVDLPSEISWSNHWPAENLHTVIPNLELLLGTFEKADPMRTLQH